MYSGNQNALPCFEIRTAVRLPNQKYILEQMMMDRAVMRKIQVAFGKWFARPRVGNLGFEIIEFALIAQTQLVNEDRRIFVGVGMSAASYMRRQLSLCDGRERSPGGIRQGKGPCCWLLRRAFSWPGSIEYLQPR